MYNELLMFLIDKCLNGVGYIIKLYLDLKYI